MVDGGQDLDIRIGAVNGQVAFRGAQSSFYQVGTQNLLHLVHQHMSRDDLALLNLPGLFDEDLVSLVEEQ